MGAHFGSPQFDAFGITDQIKLVNAGQIDTTLGYQIVTNPDQLLTSWVQKSSADYTFPEEMFGKCQKEPTDTVPIPGNCVVGGRTGYSVRIISRDFLLSDLHQLGGRSAARSVLLNPPPTDF